VFFFFIKGGIRGRLIDSSAVPLLAKHPDKDLSDRNILCG